MNADPLFMVFWPALYDPRVLPVIDELGQELHVRFVARWVG